MAEHTLQRVAIPKFPQVPLLTQAQNFPTNAILVTVPKPVVPVTPTVPKPVVPVTSTVPKPVVPVTPKVPRPVLPVTPTVPKPLTPMVPKPLTLITTTVPKPLTPTVPKLLTPTVPKPLTPTIPKPLTPTVPKPLTIITPTVPKPLTIMTPTVPKPLTPTVPKPSTLTLPKPLTLAVPKPKITIESPRVTGHLEIIPEPAVISPEMIDEDTIIAHANTLNQSGFTELLQILGHYYHNDESPISDEIYDELVDIYEAKYGPYTVVGAEPTGKKVKLPYYLGSLRKLKKEQELTTWLKSYPGPYIIEDKIDGLTLLLVSSMELGRRVNKLYTRGGGYNGLDVSHLLGYMKLPQLNVDIAVRGEVVMTRESFARVGAGFKNARNLVSGIVNAKKQFNPTLARELSFYSYRIVNKEMTPEEDINKLRELGFFVPNPVQAQALNKEILENYYNTRKKEAPYEMDGLVIYQNRQGEYPIGEAPKHIVAFKTETETVVTTVTNVVWRASKDKLLKPVVYYETSNLSGADLHKASGYNARFIVNNNIGPGARILITRSGDVIPKILSVVTPSSGGPAYPDPAKHGNYNWNSNGVEFVVTNNNPDVIAGKLKHFLDTLGIKNAGRKRVESMVAAGIRDITTLITVTPDQLAGIPGIGPTLSTQFYKDIHDRITNVSLARIMDASGLFEKIGERRFEAILDIYPNLLDLAYTEPEEISRYIRRVKGFNMLADQIAEKLATFADWLKQHPQITIELPMKIPPQTITFPTLQGQPLISQTTPFPTQHLTIQTTPFPVQQEQGRKLLNMAIVFSGFRDKDKELENRIRSQGGRITSDVSKNTSLLVMKDINDLKGKGQKAIKLGIPIISREDFLRTYL